MRTVVPTLLTLLACLVAASPAQAQHAGGRICPLGVIGKAERRPQQRGLRKARRSRAEAEADARRTLGDVGQLLGERLRRYELAKRLVETAGTADAGDGALAIRGLMQIPLADLQLLLDQRTRIVIVRGGITEFATDLAGEQPRGWPEDTTFDDVPGIYFPSTDIIVVGIQGHGEKAGPHLPRGGLTLLHEVGHALDPAFHADAPVGDRDPDFRAARDAEADALDDYFVQEGDAGYQETFAEVYARTIAGDEEWLADKEELVAHFAEDPLHRLLRVKGLRPSGVVSKDLSRFAFRFKGPRSGAEFQITVEDEDGARVSATPTLTARLTGYYLLDVNVSLQPGRSYIWRVTATSSRGVALSRWLAFSTEEEERRLPGGLPFPQIGSGIVDGIFGSPPGKLAGEPAPKAGSPPPEKKRPVRRRRGMLGNLR